MHIIIHMLIKLCRMIYITLSLTIRLLFSFHREKILFQQQSKYNSSIIVSKCGSKRLMRFNSLSNGCQAQIDLTRIDYPCINYIQLMILSLIYYPYLLNEKNILIIGLGGGTLPRAVRKLTPMSSIDIIEIDPVVKEIAEKYFYFKEDSRMKVFIGDGRTLLNHFNNQHFYQIIFVDAYDFNSGLPPQMKTQEFFTQLKSSLDQNGGLLIVNLVCIYESYRNVRHTIRSVFGEKNLLTFRSNDFVNMIVIGSSSPIEDFPTINDKCNLINEMKEKLSLDVSSLLKRKQEQFTNDKFSSKIYRDNMRDLDYEEEMSLTQFVDIV